MEGDFFGINTRNLGKEAAGVDVDDPADDYCCDPEAWQILSKKFAEVQVMLDRNRSIIQQVNDNYSAGVTASTLSKNTRLIRELHANINLISRLYSAMSKRFLEVVKERRESAAGTSEKRVRTRE